MRNISLKVASAIFFTVGFLHILRVILNVSVVVAGVTVPVWFSIPGCIVAFVLAVWLFTSGT